MFEGENEILFSEETANKLLSNFMSGLFNSPIKVTGIKKDYKGLAIEFTKADATEEEKVVDANARSNIND